MCRSWRNLTWDQSILGLAPPVAWLCEGLTADREHPSPPAPHISEILVSENGIKMQDRRKQTHTSHIQVTSSHIKSHKTPLVSVGVVWHAAITIPLYLWSRCCQTEGCIAPEADHCRITMADQWLTNGWPTWEPQRWCLWALWWTHSHTVQHLGSVPPIPQSNPWQDTNTAHTKHTKHTYTCCASSNGKIPSPDLASSRPESCKLQNAALIIF